MVRRSVINEVLVASNKGGGEGGKDLDTNVLRVGRLYTPRGTWLSGGHKTTHALASVSTTQHKNDVDHSTLPLSQTDRSAIAWSHTGDF